jgi:hypothetical protein
MTCVRVRATASSTDHAPGPDRAMQSAAAPKTASFSQVIAPFSMKSAPPRRYANRMTPSMSMAIRIPAICVRKPTISRMPPTSSTIVTTQAMRPGAGIPSDPKKPATPSTPPLNLLQPWTSIAMPKTMRRMASP